MTTNNIVPVLTFGFRDEAGNLDPQAPIRWRDGVRLGWRSTVAYGFDGPPPDWRTAPVFGADDDQAAA